MYAGAAGVGEALVSGLSRQRPPPPISGGRTAFGSPAALKLQSAAGIPSSGEAGVSTKLLRCMLLDSLFPLAGFILPHPGI
jgi:hypothetical protein